MKPKHLIHHPELTKEFLENEYKTKTGAVLAKELKITDAALRRILNYFRIVKPKISKKKTCQQKAEKIIEKFPFINKEFLTQEYIVNQKSQPDFKEEFGITGDNLYILFEYYDIPKRNKSEASLTARKKTKTISTLQQKYGVSKLMDIPEAHEKRKQTMLSKYGVEYFFQQSKDKLDKIFIKNFGVNRKQFHSHLKKEFYKNLTPEQKTSFLKNGIQSNKGKNISKFENKLSNILSEMKIRHCRQFNLVYKKDDQQGQYFYDIFIPDLNVLIEYNGDYWHANPSIYKATDIINYPKGKLSAQERWNKEQHKIKVARESGYLVLIIWESETKSLKDKEIIQFLKTKLLAICSD